MRQLFPIALATVGTRESLPLYRDAAWDFEADRAVFSAGEPVLVEGAEAVVVWCYHALRGSRYHNPAFSFRWGSELEKLVGQSYDQDTKRAEAVRYITETLTASPYVKSVSVENMAFSGSCLSAVIRIETIYGRRQLHV